jgi:L-amino acid N-acyltransferase YncA
MTQTAWLKDGSEVLIRPMTEEDLDRSLEFFTSLGEEDRAYLRVDVTKREVVERRIQAMRTGMVKRLVGLVDNHVVADGGLELGGAGWREHMGEIRLIVAPIWQRKGLGMVMARELYRLAATLKVEDIVVKVMRPQKAARNIFYRLGFREQATLREYVKDISGARQDLIVMHCDLEGLFRELEDRLSESDWQRVR